MFTNVWHCSLALQFALYHVQILCFGIFDQWNNSEKNNCYLKKKEWEDVLMECGFINIDTKVFTSLTNGAESEMDKTMALSAIRVS